jgi:hypothetical protein
MYYVYLSSSPYEYCGLSWSVISPMYACTMWRVLQIFEIPSKLDLAWRRSCVLTMQLTPAVTRPEGSWVCACATGGEVSPEPVSNGGDHDTWWRRHRRAPRDLLPPSLPPLSCCAPHVYERVTRGPMGARRAEAGPHRHTWGPCARSAPGGIRQPRRAPRVGPPPPLLLY